MPPLLRPPAIRNPRHADFARLVWEERMTYAEAAAALGVKARTAEKWRHRYLGEAKRRGWRGTYRDALRLLFGEREGQG